MANLLGETIRRIRVEKGYSQRYFAEMINVDRSTVTSWETGRRVPDAAMISIIAKSLDIDVLLLINSVKSEPKTVNVIIVDDEPIILSGGIPILEQIMPNATITGFTKPSDAIEFIRNNTVSLAFLDIEMGQTSGLDLCREILSIKRGINVIFLTSYVGYSLDAWSTGACGFILKPLTAENVKDQLTRLRHPFIFGGREHK